jgi:hypothetical protein
MLKSDNRFHRARVPPEKGIDLLTVVTTIPLPLGSNAAGSSAQTMHKLLL